jgi:beta-lactamase class D
MRAIPLVCIALAAACGGNKKAMPAAAPSDAASPVDAVAIDASTEVDISGLTDVPACFVVRGPDGAVRQSDEAACRTRILPASTFKIANALVGADVGLLDGPDAIMKYDARAYPRDPEWPEGWDHDQTLREALLISAVPLFRRLAVQIGPERMQAHLDAFEYGNRSIGGGQDRFWLTGGGLAISAPEQVAFLSKLLAGTLPVKPEAMATVREALPTETSGDATLHWKTGTAHPAPDPWIAWLVGWVERPDGNHVFACWLRDVGDFDVVRSHRMEVCKGVLTRLGLWGPA